MSIITKIKNIKDVLVNKISLVTDNETPAVPKATTKFALFKTKKKANSSKLDKLIKTLQTKQKIDTLIDTLH